MELGSTWLVLLKAKKKTKKKNIGITLSPEIITQVLLPQVKGKICILDNGLNCLKINL